MPQSYKRVAPEGAWDAIVIGSGMGGLAAAALLSRYANKRVLVLERHYTAGGYTHVFKRPRYEWDVGLHYIGGVGRHGTGVRELFDAVSGGRLAWAPMPDVYDRVFFGDDSYDLVAGRRRQIESLASRFARHRREIERYFALCDRAVGATLPYFVDRALPSALSRALGPVLRAPMFHYSDRTVQETLQGRISDPRLFDLLTAQCGDYGLLPSEASFAVHAMVVGHYAEGGFYPVGGAGAILRECETEIAASGGEIFTNAEVASIECDRGRAIGVRMIDGRALRAPIVISDAGAPATWLSLLPREIAEPTGLPDRIRAVPGSTGHVCLYLGIDGTDRELGLDGTNLWIYPPRDRDAAWARFADDPSAPFPVVYVSFPSAKDPEWIARHPGRATVEVITMARLEWFKRWEQTQWMKRGGDYRELKAQISDRLLEVLFEHRPQLRGRIAHAELSTPLSTKHFMGYEQGEMYGLAHTPARFRLPLAAQTPVPGLYFAGQDLVSCGVAGALMGGALCAAAIARSDLRSLIRRRRAASPSPISDPRRADDRATPASSP